MSWSHPPPLWVPLAWVAAVHLAAWGLGSWAHDRLVSPGRGLRNAVVRQALGLAILAQLVFLSALAGWSRPWFLGSLLSVAAVSGGVRILRERPGVVGSGLRVEDLPAVLAGTFYASFLPRALDPVLYHDDSTYHLYLPRRYLEAGGLVDIPSLLYANMPHLSEVLYTLPMASGDVTAPKVLVFSVVAWTLLGLWSFAVPFCGRLGAGVLLLAVVGSKSLQWHLGSAYVEPLLALFLLAAALSLDGWRGESGAGPGRLAVAGFLAGTAAAAKYTAWMFAGALGLVGLVLVARRRRWLAGSGALVGAALLPVLPWTALIGLRTGNPLYPNLYPWFGGRDWSDVLDFQYRIAPSLVEKNAGWLQILVAPWNLTVRDNYYSAPSFSAALMALFLVGSVVSVRGRDPSRAWLVAAAWTGFGLWALTLIQGRYLVAWVPVMALVAVAALEPLRHRTRLLVTLGLVVLAADLAQLVLQRYPYEPEWATLAVPRAERVAGNANHDLVRYLETVVPEDGKILALWDNRFFFLERSFEADSAFHAPLGLDRLRRTGDASRFADRLRQEGFTHVVVYGPPMVRYFERRYPWSLTDPVRYPESRLAEDERLLRELVAREMRLLRVVDAHAVYRLRESRETAP